MKNKHVLFIAVLLCGILPAAALFGQQVKVTPIELSVALSSGNVTLSASGTGYSSGHGAVTGTLTNTTSLEISINLEIKGGLYLRNSGSGQNMLATRIIPPGRNNTNKFITLSAGASIGISFEAYCVDLELDNPSKSESFSVDSMPPVLLSITQKIGSYQENNPEVDLVIPIQLMLWRSQGKSQAEISAVFEFSLLDWITSAVIMNY